MASSVSRIICVTRSTAFGSCLRPTRASAPGAPSKCDVPEERALLFGETVEQDSMTANSSTSPEGSILTPNGWVTGKVEFAGQAISALDGRTKAGGKIGLARCGPDGAGRTSLSREAR